MYIPIKTQLLSQKFSPPSCHPFFFLWYSKTCCNRFLSIGKKILKKEKRNHPLVKDFSLMQRAFSFSSRQEMALVSSIYFGFLVCMAFFITSQLSFSRILCIHAFVTVHQHLVSLKYHTKPWLCLQTAEQDFQRQSEERYNPWCETLSFVPSLTWRYSTHTWPWPNSTQWGMQWRGLDSYQVSFDVHPYQETLPHQTKCLVTQPFIWCLPLIEIYTIQTFNCKCSTYSYYSKQSKPTTTNQAKSVRRIYDVCTWKKRKVLIKLSYSLKYGAVN